MYKHLGPYVQYDRLFPFFLCGVSLPGRRACAPLAAPTQPLPLLAACPSAEGGAPEAQASVRRDHSSDAAFPTASSLATPPPLLLVRSWSGILPLSAQWARATVSGVNVHNDDRGTPRPISWAIHPPHPPTHPPIHPPTHLPTRPPTPALTPPAPCHRPPPLPDPFAGDDEKACISQRRQLPLC